MEIDLNGKGLGVMLKDYQILAMEDIWNRVGKGMSSREVWMQVNAKLAPKTISRASIINFLNDMVEEGFLDYTEITGKGGHRAIYCKKLDRAQFWLEIIKRTKETLMRGSGWMLRIEVLKG